MPHVFHDQLHGAVGKLVCVAQVDVKRYQGGHRQKNEKRNTLLVLRLIDNKSEEHSHRFSPRGAQ